MADDKYDTWRLVVMTCKLIRQESAIDMNGSQAFLVILYNDI
jgi:hypothetical protein